MKRLVGRRISWLVVLLPALVWAQTAAPARVAIEKYIADTWATLTRSHRELARAAVDPKFPAPADGRWPVYVPANANLVEIRGELQKEMEPGTFDKVDLRLLPAAGARMPEQGLLYLPRPYVVPGGRFNEMYGWDSYFIVLGLLHDGKTDLAKDMVDNFLYEIRNYGKILNANRTYYLTRSQPPFLTEMLLAVYQATGDKEWLRQALPAVTETHRFWTSPPHLTESSGLSRYWDFGEGPAAEVLSAEKDAQGRNHYDLVKDYYRTHDVSDYDLTQYFDRAHDQFKPLFYKGDRSMRESGFDPSNRFGPFNIDIIHYNPVCLNSLLYLMEEQAAQILETLGQGGEAKPWHDRAAQRAALINRLLWDEPSGLYADYNFELKKRRAYPFLTTFYPLWAGIASPAQAARVRANLKLFEQPGGLRTSTFVSGNQWDAPFGWAPLEMIAVEGLRRYGFNEDADRISRAFLSLVRESYQRDGVIVEKYDVTARGTSTAGAIRFGYHTNEPGFGWTNAVYTRLSDELRERH
jgi:alpha,alpha-trehalase